MDRLGRIDQDFSQTATGLEQVGADGFFRDQQQGRDLAVALAVQVEQDDAAHLLRQRLDRRADQWARSPSSRSASGSISGSGGWSEKFPSPSSSGISRPLRLPRRGAAGGSFRCSSRSRTTNPPSPPRPQAGGCPAKPERRSLALPPPRRKVTPDDDTTRIECQWLRKSSSTIREASRSRRRGSP